MSRHRAAVVVTALLIALPACDGPKGAPSTTTAPPRVPSIAASSAPPRAGVLEVTDQGVGRVAITGGFADASAVQTRRAGREPWMQVGLLNGGRLDVANLAVDTDYDFRIVEAGEVVATVAHQTGAAPVAVGRIESAGGGLSLAGLAEVTFPPDALASGAEVRLSISSSTRVGEWLARGARPLLVGERSAWELHIEVLHVSRPPDRVVATFESPISARGSSAVFVLATVESLSRDGSPSGDGGIEPYGFPVDGNSAAVELSSFSFLAAPGEPDRFEAFVLTAPLAMASAPESTSSAVSALPADCPELLLAPLDEYTLTTPAGPRPDPSTGQTRWHDGLDLAGAEGAPVSAAVTGEIEVIDDGADGLGYSVVERSASGIITYGHLDEGSAGSNGSRRSVRAGEQIAVIGAEPLHFDYRPAAVDLAVLTGSGPHQMDPFHCIDESDRPDGTTQWLAVVSITVSGSSSLLESGGGQPLDATALIDSAEVIILQGRSRLSVADLASVEPSHAVTIQFDQSNAEGVFGYSRQVYSTVSCDNDLGQSGQLSLGEHYQSGGKWNGLASAPLGLHASPPGGEWTIDLMRPYPASARVLFSAVSRWDSTDGSCPVPAPLSSTGAVEPITEMEYAIDPGSTSAWTANRVLGPAVEIGTSGVIGGHASFPLLSLGIVALSPLAQSQVLTSGTVTYTWQIRSTYHAP